MFSLAKSTNSIRVLKPTGFVWIVGNIVGKIGNLTWIPFVLRHRGRIFNSNNVYSKQFFSLKNVLLFPGWKKSDSHDECMAEFGTYKYLNKTQKQLPPILISVQHLRYTIAYCCACCLSHWKWELLLSLCALRSSLSLVELPLNFYHFGHLSIRVDLLSLSLFRLPIRSCTSLLVFLLSIFCASVFFYHFSFYFNETNWHSVRISNQMV